MNALTLKKIDSVQTPSPFKNRVQNTAQGIAKFSEKHQKINKRRSFSPCNTNRISSPGLSPIKNTISPVLHYNQSAHEKRALENAIPKPLLPKKTKKSIGYVEMNSTKINLTFTPSPRSPNGNSNNISKNSNASWEIINTSSDNNTSNNNTTNNSSNSSIADSELTPTTIFNKRITIDSILKSKGLSSYKRAFKNIDLKSFLNFKDSDLINIGIDEKKDRDVLLQAIEDL